MAGEDAKDGVNSVWAATSGSWSGEEDARKRLGDTSKRDTREETAEIIMSSPPAVATFDAGTVYAARVDEEALRSAARRDGSSEESWVQNPRSGIWTMVDQSIGEAKPRLREDMGTRGVYSHSLGNNSGGSITLWGVIASDVGDAVHIEDLPVVKIPHYDANTANLDDFFPDSEDSAQELVAEMWFGSDARDKWACRTFRNRLAPEWKADWRDAIREKRISTEEQCFGT